MKINEVARLSGVTARTLHYYDKIGLLKPSKTLDNGYREYDHENLETLQQILFFRELDFSLKEIKDIISNSNYNKKQALKNHRQLLIKKSEHIENLIKLIDKTMKGDLDMSFKQFDNSDIEKCKEKYKDEVLSRWGNTSAYKESEEKTKDYSKSKWKEIGDEANKIFKSFAENSHLSPDCESVQNLVKTWQDYITKNFYTCTKEILSSLGEMSISDERFKENIDKNGDGTAKFLSDAIKIYCSK